MFFDANIDLFKKGKERMTFRKSFKILCLNGLFLVLLCVNLSLGDLSNSMSTKQELDFKSLVEKFCGSNREGFFCSNQNLKLMFEIEEKRQKERELAHQLKRMEQQIIKNILKMVQKI